MRIFILFIASVAIAVVLLAINQKHAPPRPPMIVPIAIDRTGLVLDIEFEVIKHRVYYFSLRHSFPEKDDAERARIRSIIAGDTSQDNGTTAEALLTPVAVSIFASDKNSTTQVYYQRVTPILTGWGADNFTMNIGHCDFPPGRYRARLESFSAHPAFASIKTSFAIGMNTFKNSFDPNHRDRSMSCPQ